jgi:hypothetical protein
MVLITGTANGERIMFSGDRRPMADFLEGT